jgi:hypothetical protein
VSPQATSTNANQRSEPRSQRTCSRRQQLSHDSARSTRQRCRPNRSRTRSHAGVARHGWPRCHSSYRRPACRAGPGAGPMACAPAGCRRPPRPASPRRGVGGGDRHGQRQPTPLADQVQLGPGLAAIDRTCANMVPPRLARTLLLSKQARDQSSRPCSPSRFKISRCNASNTPALAHWFSRRQTVAGEPQPSSWAGSRRQGVDVRAVNTTAAKQLRSGMLRRRPPCLSASSQTSALGRPTSEVLDMDYLSPPTPTKAPLSPMDRP